MKSKDNKVKTKKIVNSKVEFVDKIVFPIEISSELTLLIKENDPISEGQVIAKYVQKEKSETINFLGDPTVNVGDEIKQGDVIAVKKGLVKKKTNSTLNGIVNQVTSDQITIAIKEEIDPKLADQKVVSPIEALAIKVMPGKVLLEFSGTQFHLLASKGENSSGKILYISASDFEAKKNMPETFKGRILVTDHLTASMYPELAALDVEGIITYSIDYAIFEEIIILTVPLGVYSGFGKFDVNKNLLKYFMDSDGKNAWFDSQYSRLLIQEKKKPVWLSGYEFDLTPLVEIP